jgi:hypothetical protein
LRGRDRRPVRRAGPRYRSHGPAAVGGSAADAAPFAQSASTRPRAAAWGLPRNPLPPHTTSFFLAVAEAEAEAMAVVYSASRSRAAGVEFDWG